MNKQPKLFIIWIVMLPALFLHSISTNAAEKQQKNAANDLELICFTEQPAIVEGEDTTLKALASTLDGRPITTPIKFEWEVDAGHVEAQAAATRWDLSAVKIGPNAVRKVIATVKTIQPGRSELSCAVEVFIGKKDAIDNRRALRSDNLFSARGYLLRNDVEAPGYGLYSYLLFSAPPKDAEERARYMKAIEAYLLVLQDVEDYLSRHVRPRSLNITYIPIKTAPVPGKSTTEFVANVLAVYDYTAAQMLLSKVQQGYPQGPYLISVLKPLSKLSQPPHLWEDLTGVVPELAWNWISFFTYLAAQQRSWSEDSLQRFSLKLRNLIAVGGKVTPDVVEGFKKAIQFKPKV